MSFFASSTSKNAADVMVNKYDPTLKWDPNIQGKETTDQLIADGWYISSDKWSEAPTVASSEGAGYEFGKDISTALDEIKAFFKIITDTLSKIVDAIPDLFTGAFDFIKYAGEDFLSTIAWLLGPFTILATFIGKGIWELIPFIGPLIGDISEFFVFLV